MADRTNFREFGSRERPIRIDLPVNPLKAETPTISLITTCKGRLSHLRQLLPSFVSIDVEEVIVVDYDCPDQTSAFVRSEFPVVKVVEHFDLPFFNISDARNSGAKAAKGDYLLFVDADVIISEAVRRELEVLLRSADLVAFLSKNCGVHGSCIIKSDLFREIGGYDEVLGLNYGFEDRDLYLRARLASPRSINVNFDNTVHLNWCD